MKRLIPVIIGTIALVGCVSKTDYVTSTEAPTTAVKVPKTTDAPIATSAPEPVYTDNEEFIYDIENNYDLPINLDDEVMIEMGNATCTSLRAGLSATAVVKVVISSANGDSDIEDLFIAIVGAGVVNFCPEQSYKFDN